MHDIIQNQVKAFIDLRTNFNDIKNLSAIYPSLSGDLLRNNIDAICKRDTSSEFIKQLPKGYVEMNCPITNTLAKSQHSLPLGEANALYFKGEEPFYILQGNFCVEAFYYPETSVFILLRGCLDHEIKLQRLLTLLKDKGAKLESYYQQPTKFDGFYCFHQSPYHYYYFKVSHLLPTLEEVCELNDISVYSLSGKSYLDLSKISEKISKDIVLDKMFTLEKQVDQASFYVCIGEHRKDLTKQKIETCDLYVKQFLINKEFENNKIDKIKKLRKTHYVLWLGITSGKRTWIEQIPTYKKVIEGLLDIASNVVVLVDGWTKGREFEDETPVADKKLADKLMSSFAKNKNIEFINLVAEEAEIKAKAALDVDFFIANHSTGSIWVSRIAGANGVTHISNVARESAISQHIHPNAQLISKDYITDIESEDAQTPFHVSYSILPEQFMSVVLPLLAESYSVKKKNINSWKVFQNLNFTNQTNPADALRDIAVAFEKIGDRKTAYALMCKALEQRPNGPFIKQKVNDWKPKP